MSESEIDLDNLPLAEALRFADEGSTTGGLVTRAALKTLAAGCRELAAARAEIEKLSEQNRLFRNETLICADCDAISKEEYDQAIEQRDRLAVALKEIDGNRHGRNSGFECRAIARKALQMNSKSESKPPVEQPRLVRLSSAALKVWLECEKDTPFFCRRSIDKSCYEVGRQTNEDWRECISEDRIFIGRFATEEEAQAVYDEHRIKWMWEEICKANAKGETPT
jgi:hypothetical protein